MYASSSDMLATKAAETASSAAAQKLQSNARYINVSDAAAVCQTNAVIETKNPT